MGSTLKILSLVKAKMVEALIWVEATTSVKVQEMGEAKDFDQEENKGLSRVETTLMGLEEVRDMDKVEAKALDKGQIRALEVDMGLTSAVHSLVKAKRVQVRVEAKALGKGQSRALENQEFQTFLTLAFLPQTHLITWVPLRMCSLKTT